MFRKQTKHGHYNGQALLLSQFIILVKQIKRGCLQFKNPRGVVWEMIKGAGCIKKYINYPPP